MNVEQERSQSPWMDVALREFPRLTSDQETDVLIIGAGIAGLSTAYELTGQGRTVLMVDRGRPARGQTARTTAHLAFEMDDYYAELIRVLGEDRARQIYESQSAAVDRMEEICRIEGLDADFARIDGYFIPADADGVETLTRELPAARRVGFTDAEWVDEGALPWQPDSIALRFPRQGRIHPLKYLDGLIDRLVDRGVRIFQDTAMVDLESSDGGVCAVTEEGFAIHAKQVVVATNTPFHLRVPIHTKQAPYRTYVIAAPVPKGHVPDALIWDTLEPGYHYVRLQPGSEEDLLIVGGEDHKTGEADDGAERIDRLETWARSRWPQMGAISHAWSGQVYEPSDFAPYIGRTSDHPEVYLVTGDSGQGITTGVAASLILRDLMSGRENPWASVYDPSRLPLHPHALATYASESVTAVKGLAEHVLPRHEHAGGRAIETANDLAPGEGGLIAKGAGKVATYRDPAGVLHMRSAACTHVGCAVHWNSFETCWDCPCHGSQFDIEGRPLNGPAVRPLGEVDADPA